MLDSLPDNFPKVRVRQTVGNLNRFRSKLGQLLVQPVKAGSNPLIVLQVLAASENIIVDLLKALDESSALLAERLAQVVHIGLDNLLLHRPYLLCDLALHVLKRLK